MLTLKSPSKRMSRFCDTLLGQMFTPYNRVLARLETADTKVEPNLQLLTVLHEVDLICHLWQQYVNMALLPLASSSVTVRREMVVFNNQTVSRIEGTANTLMQRMTDGSHHFSLPLILHLMLSY